MEPATPEKSANALEPTPALSTPATVPLRKAPWTEADKEKALQELRRIYGDQWVLDHAEYLEEQHRFLLDF